jgi:hypothetical protein
MPLFEPRGFDLVIACNSLRLTTMGFDAPAGRCLSKAGKMIKNKTGGQRGERKQGTMG